MAPLIGSSTSAAAMPLPSRNSSEVAHALGARGDLDDPAEEGVYGPVQVPEPHAPVLHVQVRLLKRVAREA
jgi:hypothetical protein